MRNKTRSVVPQLADLLNGLTPAIEATNNVVQVIDNPTIVIFGEYEGSLDMEEDLDNGRVNATVARMFHDAICEVENLDHSRFQVQGVSFHFDPFKGGKMRLEIDLYDAEQ